MRIAVIGNGPSAINCAADSADFVVRCGQFTRALPDGRAGTRLDAWAWPGYAKMNKYAPPRAAGARPKWAMWITCPYEWHKGQQRKQNVCSLSRRMSVPVSIIRYDLYLRVRKHLKKFSPRRDFPPTTGLLAIAMAVQRGLNELYIAGFDGGFGKGYVYADGRKLRHGLHDPLAENKLLRHLEEQGEWLGKRAPFKFIWRKP